MHGTGPTPTSEERLSTQLHTQHQFSKKLSDRDIGKPSYHVTLRRAMAFLIDCALLTGLGIWLAHFAGPELDFLDENSWWIGILIAAAYFGTLDSRFAFGTTIGKRIMDIEVQRIDGDPPSAVDALLRFLPFGAVFAIYKLSEVGMSHSPFMLAFEAAGALILLAILVFAALHPQRRGLQDLLFNTVVVRRRRFSKLPKGRSKAALALFLSLAVAVIALQGLRAWLMFNDEDERTEAAALSLLHNIVPGIRHVKVESYEVTLNDSGYQNALLISAYTKRGDDKRIMKGKARRIAAKLASSGIMPRDLALIVVRLRSGFDIGLWRSFAQELFKYPLYGSVEVGNIKRKGIRYKIMKGRSRK